MMNPEIKEKWLTALRSGEYKQGTGQLFHEGPNGVKSYCCLGVLCDVLIKDGKLADWEKNEDGFYGIPTPASLLPLETGLAPEAALEVSGLNTRAGTLSTHINGNVSLAMLNDLGEFTFDQIADVIEEQF